MPWGHVTVLLDKLDKLDDQRDRDWYAAAAVEYGWSRNVLLNQIMSQLQPRAGTAPSNFTAQLPAADSELTAGDVMEMEIDGLGRQHQKLVTA